MKKYQGVDYYGIEGLLSEEERMIRDAVRDWVEAEFLPPIDTSHWTRENLDQHIKEVHDVYKKALPPEQQPTDDTAVR